MKRRSTGLSAKGSPTWAPASRSRRRLKQQGFSLEQSERLARMCEDRDLGFIAFTGYIKYQEHLLAEEPHRLMYMVGDDGVLDLDGLPVRYLCPFRPENKSHYLTLLMEICNWPAVREIHLNDEAVSRVRRRQRSAVTGAFCEAEFSKRSRRHASPVCGLG